MRKLSESRRNEMRARYDAILVATDGCLVACVGTQFKRCQDAATPRAEGS